MCTETYLAVCVILDFSVVKAFLNWLFSASAFSLRSDITIYSQLSNACTVSQVILDESPKWIYAVKLSSLFIIFVVDITASLED